MLVIGGGLAGLACAMALSDAGLHVRVVERADEAGGRARSITDATTGERIDLGPHILLSEYRNMLRLLDLLGTRRHVAWQGARFITLVDAPGATTLHLYPLPAPLHFLPDLLRVPQLSLADVASNARLFWRVLRLDDAGRMQLDQVDAEQYLRALGVSERFIDWYWRTVAMAIMNVPLGECSAGALLGFFRYLVGRNGYQLGLPSIGLGDLFAPAARHWIEARGGAVRLGIEAARLELAGDRACGAILADGTRLHARWTVAALPPPSLHALLPESLRTHATFRDLAAFAPSPYVSTYLWFDRRLSRERFWANTWSPRTLYYDFYDLANIRAHRDAEGSLVACNLIFSTRAAHLDDAALIDAACSELAAYLPRTREAVLRHAVVHRIPMAIPAPHPGSESLRPEARTPIRNLFLAGDWLATGLPASMESAVRGGWMAAEAVLQEAGRPRAWVQPLPRMDPLAALGGRRAAAG
ncbi:MAG: NAD(P)-binding protein [Lysobacter sp.]|nr:NAD(P)-binding protein [Lysobacter sp.]